MAECHISVAVMHCLCYSCRNLFQQQKLLSLDNDDVDVIQPIVRRPDILPRGVRQSPDGVLHWEDDSIVYNEWVQSAFDAGDASVFQSLAVLGTAVVVCGFGLKFYRRRTRQRRKHIHLTSAARRSRTIQ